MSFRLLKHSFVLERRCHHLISVASTFRSTPISHRPKNDLHLNHSLGNFTLRRYCASIRSNTDSNKAKPKHEAIYDNLKTELLSKNRVLLSGVQEYLKLCQERGLNQDEAILLLDCISYCLPYVTPVKKQDLIAQIWTKLSNDIKKQVPVILSYFKTCQLNGISINFDNALIEIGTKPSRIILEAALDYVAEKGNKNEAKRLFEEIKIRGFEIPESGYAALIRTYSISQDLKEVDSVVEMMASRNVEMTSVSQSELIQAYLRNGKEEEAKKLLHEQGKSMNEAHLLPILKTALRFQPLKDLIALILSNLPAEILTDKEIYGPFKNICSELILEQKIDEVCTFVSCLPVPTYNATDDLDLYAEFAMQEMILNNAPLKKIMKFIQLLKSEKRHEMALRTITGLALKYYSPLVNDLLDSLNQEEPLRTHYFWPLINYNSLIDGEVGVLKTLLLMKKYNVEIDTDTLTFYVLPKLAVTLKQIEKGVKELETAGVKPSILMGPLTSHLLYQQRYNETVYINSFYPSKLDTKSFINPLVTAFNFAKSNNSIIPIIAKLIKIFSDKRTDQKYDIAGHFFSVLISGSKSKYENQRLLQLIGELSLHGVKISRIAAEMLQQHLSKDLNETQIKTYFGDFVDKRITLPADELLDSHIKHPRDMNLEELECHFRELESKGLNTRGVLRRLLQLNVREKRIDRALEVKKNCDKNNVDLSPGMHAAIFDIYVKTGCHNEAGAVLRKLQQQFPGFLIDDHKVVDFAALLVEKGNIEEAQRVLRMRAKVSPLKDSNHISKNVWQLLSNVANIAPTLKDVKANENQTKQFFQFLVQLNYCSYQNSVLGPVIKEYLNKNDLKSAVAEYTFLCKEYRITPLQRQLMTVLVDASNRPEAAERFSTTKSEVQDMLQTIIQSTTTVYGPTNTNIALILALAEAGTEKQLRKLLIDPKARFSPEVLRKQCEYLNSVGKLDALLKLAKCSRGLGHIHEQNIYNMVLDTLIEENNYEAAINLFDDLLSDDEFKVSSEFIRNLVDLLKRNNLELPTNVALHAK